MVFITNDDLSPVIKTNIVADILQIEEFNSGTTSVLLNDTEVKTISIITSYIGHYYDCDLIFAQSGTTRNYMMVEIVIDLMLYDLESRTSTNIVPELRVDRYSRAIDTLQKISQRKLVPELPEKNILYESKTQLLWGSFTKNNYDY